jgi:hypothetical protein
MTQTKQFDPWLQQVVDECSDKNAELDLLKFWHSTLEKDVQLISSDDNAPFTDEEIQQYIEVINIIEGLIKARTKS